MKHVIAVHEKAAAIYELAARHHASNPRLFGSALTGAESGNSDVDLLVDALPGATLLDLGALQVELEILLGVSVDLLTPGDLPKRFRDQVLSDARAI